MKKALVIIFLILFTNALHAQLSPGDLHNVHKNLEGLQNCVKCHEIGKKISSEKCLSCHSFLKERIAARQGLHANPEYQNCINCHVEHHGRNFELIHWNGGKQNFDHTQTGYKLIDKHASLKCESCHQSKFIVNTKKLVSSNINPEHTFLGLSQNCLSCHHDEHRGQMSESCLNCHSLSGWKTAPLFDHNKTKFALTGKHAKVPCNKCHVTIVDNRFESDAQYLKFAGRKFQRCTDCHQDAHKNKFGSNCERCHNTSGWENYNRTNFDHKKTNYPLQGKHAKVKCSQCHLPGKSLKIKKYNRCADCHRDYHQEQLAHRPQKGECSECHSVVGFTPVQFTIEQHQKTDYPLAGSHLAIPCNSCHVKINRNRKNETVRLNFKSTKCAACHKDPHKGEVNKFLSKNGCEYCHSTISWRNVTFDHNQTKFPLQGRHATIKCSECHKSSKAGKANVLLKFNKLSTQCQSCHGDVHLGQFRESRVLSLTRKIFTRCERCHTPVDWIAEKFDHNKDSKFKIEGSHKNVACEQCHRKADYKGKQVAIYKPLNAECQSCHNKKK